MYVILFDAFTLGHLRKPGLNGYRYSYVSTSLTLKYVTCEEKTEDTCRVTIGKTQLEFEMLPLAPNKQGFFNLLVSVLGAIKSQNSKS